MQTLWFTGLTLLLHENNQTATRPTAVCSINQQAASRKSNKAARAKMVLMYTSLAAAASCSICVASAFVGSPPTARITADGRMRPSFPFLSEGDSFLRVSTATDAVPVAPQQQQQQQRRRRLQRRRQTAIPPLLLSSRTVDVDVIDVTDVTEEEARREKEQVRE